VIGPGWLPRLRPAARKRTLAYTRMRRTKRRAKAARASEVRHPEIVLFDHGSSELPVATLVSRGTTGLLAGLQRWLIARWLWLSPRAVPVVVAAAGMILVLISADYLAHAHGAPAPGWHVRIVGP